METNNSIKQQQKGASLVKDNCIPLTRYDYTKLNGETQKAFPHKNRNMKMMSFITSAIQYYIEVTSAYNIAIKTNSYTD